jgi:hypothetical protein
MKPLTECRSSPGRAEFIARFFCKNSTTGAAATGREGGVAVISQGAGAAERGGGDGMVVILWRCEKRDGGHLSRGGSWRGGKGRMAVISPGAAAGGVGRGGGWWSSLQLNLTNIIKYPLGVHFLQLYKLVV